MEWEITRHDWASIRPDLADMGRVIESLISTSSDQEAENLYLKIDFAVLRNGALRPGAAQVASCLVQGLLAATTEARPHVLDLLVQLGSGVASLADGGDTLTSDVRWEVLLGLPIYSQVLESGSRTERFHCIDLIGVCGEADSRVRSRARALLTRAAELGEQESELVQATLKHLDQHPGTMT